MNRFLDVSAEVAQALVDGRPVVALESTIISHGMPWPRNAETARRVEAAVRDRGAIPATIAVVDGRLKAGISNDEIDVLARTGQAVIKCSRRDLPWVISQKQMGATTVAATMIIAAMAGIRVFATGGIGRVHRGAATSFDISADLQELAKTSVAVVCAGAKSILDLKLTREYLETCGVPVLGYQTDRLPAFYSRDSDESVDYRFDSSADIATFLSAKWDCDLEGGVVVANPVPEDYAMPAAEIERVIANALEEATKCQITGKAITPFLLEKISQMTGQSSLDTNIQLVLNNARLGAEIAAHVASSSAPDHSSRP